MTTRESIENLWNRATPVAPLLDAYRTEVLRKAADRLRAIPIQCTALTGPVWYGTGWREAITQLEEIADYQTPDDQAYPGELEMLRGLLLNLRVAARKGDMDRVRQLITSHDARAAQEALNEGTPRQPAYDAVFAYIREQSRDFLPTTVVDRNAMIWHAVHAALDAMGVPSDESTAEVQQP